MAIDTFHFGPKSFNLPASNAPGIEQLADDVCLTFDDTTEETAYTPRVRASGYGGGTLTAKLLVAFESETTITDEAVLAIGVEAVTPGDALDIGGASPAKSFDTENTVEVDPSATAGHPIEASVTLANKDGIADGDWVRFSLARKVGDAADTGTGDIRVYGVEISEA